MLRLTRQEFAAWLDGAKSGEFDHLLDAQARQIFDQLGTLPAILLVAARAGEPELRGFAAEMGGKRLTDVTRIVRAVAVTGDLRPDLDATRAAHIMWTLGSPEVHLQLTDDRGWSAGDYESWLGSHSSKRCSAIPDSRRRHCHHPFPRISHSR